MSNATTTLTNCDLEPIHIPGKIQSHGFLIAVDTGNIIRFISSNTPDFISGVYPGLLGKPLSEFELVPHLPDPTLNPLRVNIGQSQFYLIISAAGEFTLLEFEPSGTGNIPDVQQMVGQSIEGILGGKDLPALLQFAAGQVKKIIGFDRVMIYRFASDGHGEVIAEAKNKILDPWLGLHYPASDIPKQARELYKLNKTRLIADVHAEAAGIASIHGYAQQLDLTWSQLRSVSPVHIQYLKNMGVASSFSISLLYKNELWGLVACHNYTPCFINYNGRESAKLVGQLLSAALEFRQNEENLQHRSFYEHQVDTISKNLHSKNSLEDALMHQDNSILNLVQATGVVIAYNNKITTGGWIPGDGDIGLLIKWLSETMNETVFYTSSLATDYPSALDYRELAGGILVVSLSKEPGEYIIWFREEIIRQVKWAGNPEKPVELSEGGLLQISPRNSFDTWLKDVSGTCTPWTTEEINAVLKLREEIFSSVATKASALRALNERLQQAYEELDTFSFTISHDLKTPLTAIRGYAQLLTAWPGIPANAQQLIPRIVERADRMSQMIKAVLDYSRVGRLPLDLHMVNTGEMIAEIVQDIEQVYGSSGVKISVGNTPPVPGDPVMIWQVFSNLISNAVKYAQHAAPPLVHIEGYTTEKQVFYSIRDNGIGIAPNDTDQVFLLFSRMANVKDIEGTGVGLAIVKKIMEKHGGGIWLESELHKGTTFFLSFNRHS